MDISLAIDLTCKSSHPKHRHSAILFGKNGIVAWANNRGNEHAEWRAIQIAKLLGIKEKLILYSCAINKKGELKLALPCVGCQFSIKYSGIIKDVYYSTPMQTFIKMPKW